MIFFFFEHNVQGEKCLEAVKTNDISSRNYATAMQVAEHKVMLSPGIVCTSSRPWIHHV